MLVHLFCFSVTDLSPFAAFRVFSAYTHHTLGHLHTPTKSLRGRLCHCHAFLEADHFLLFSYTLVFSSFMVIFMSILEICRQEDIAWIRFCLAL